MLRREECAETLLFCTSYIPSSSNEVVADGVERWRRWIDYYSQRMELFGADRLVVIDDGSPLENLRLPVTILAADTPLPRELPPGVVLFRFSEHLGRSSMYCFPGWWRSFSFAAALNRVYNFRKIIHIESDAYVLSERLADYMKSCEQGWISFVQGHYRSRFTRLRFPRRAEQSFLESVRMKSAYLIRPAPLAETALQVLCEDAIPALLHLWHQGPACWQAQLMAEQRLPFTHLERRFIGDRYGEMGLVDYPTDVDFVSQARPEWEFSSRLTTEPSVLSATRRAF